MNETSGTTAADAPAQPPTEVPEQDGATQGGAPSAPPTPAAEQPASFGGRGRMRRRARFLRRARELAYRDLGGLVFDLHRYGQRNDALVLAKLTTLTQIDSQLRALEAALEESRPVTVLREAGITACPRCAAIHSSEDNFCPNCGFSVERNVDLPIAGAAPAAPSAPVQAPYAPAGPATHQHQIAAAPYRPAPTQQHQTAAGPYGPAPGGPPTQQHYYTQASPYGQPPAPQASPSSDAPPVPAEAPGDGADAGAAVRSSGARAPVPPAREGASETTEIVRPPAGR